MTVCFPSTFLSLDIGRVTTWSGSGLVTKFHIGDGREVTVFLITLFLQCHGEECTILFRDPCSEGYNCTLDNPERSFITGGSGHCRSPNETIEGHDNVDGHPEIHSFI